MEIPRDFNKMTVGYRPLGALRLGLALMVMGQHYQHLLPAGERGFFRHSGLGLVAVAVFFAISGLIVAEALARFYQGRPWAFLGNRLLRLGPGYFAALVISVAVQWGLWRAGRLGLWDYTLVGSPLALSRLAGGVLGLLPGFNPGWSGQEFEFIPYVWSLRLEMGFYLAAALAAGILARWRRAWVVGGMMAGGLAGSGWFILATWRPSALSTVGMFLLGVGVFLWERRRGWALGWFLAACLTVGMMGFLSWRQRGEPYLWVQMPLVVGLWGGMMGLARMRAGGWVKRWDQFLGGLSYPLYLNHYAVGILVFSCTPRLGWGVFLAAGLVSLAVAWGMGRVVEGPVASLRDRVRGVRI